MFPAEDTPEVIGTYRIVRRLASTGPAEVYLARSEGPLGFARECALKLLPDTSEGDASFAEELAREAAICGKLNHPAIVRAFDFFAFRGKLVLALEHVEGTTLAELMTHVAEKRQRLGDAAAYYVGARVAGAVADAHAARDEDGKPTPIVHRNLTPENVLVSLDGEVRLTGFGLGKIVGRTPDSAIGKIKGTPGFMAPEQARGEPVTPKADVYGLGLLVWSLLAGRRPPTDGTWPRRITGLRTDLPKEVAAVVDAALDHFPGTRRISAREMEQWLSKAAPPTRGKAELKERVAELRAARAVKTADAPPAPYARARPPRVPPPANPFQGVRFGAPEAPQVPRPTAAKRAAAPPPAATPAATALSRAVQNLPPPPPPEAPVTAAPPVPAPRFGSPRAEPAPTPVEALPVQPSPPPPEPAPASARGQVLPLPSLLPLGAASLAAMLPRSSLPGMRPPPPLETLGSASAHGAAVEAPATPGDGPVPPSLLPLDSTRQPLSAAGTILVSAVTAAVVVAAGLYLYVHRGSASSPVAAAQGPASAAPAPTAPAVPATSTAASEASAAPAPSANPADLPYGYGYLTVVSPASANVYLSGKIAGPVNQALKVRCGRWFVRLAAPPESRYPDWVSPGETVVVACQEATRMELGRRP